MYGGRAGGRVERGIILGLGVTIEKKRGTSPEEGGPQARTYFINISIKPLTLSHKHLLEMGEKVTLCFTTKKEVFGPKYTVIFLLGSVM